ncbi:hypothetical protein WJX72_001234 [[Myrmecia] bisecta]|uniref:Uncharacterized protein n=1 Tax=[Myrmecia] bisecta TaxID=41462 RepID=A0AAW1PM48_9CHLO
MLAPEVETALRSPPTGLDSDLLSQASLAQIDAWQQQYDPSRARNLLRSEQVSKPALQALVSRCRQAERPLSAGHWRCLLPPLAACRLVAGLPCASHTSRQIIAPVLDQASHADPVATSLLAMALLHILQQAEEFCGEVLEEQQAAVGGAGMQKAQSNCCQNALDMLHELVGAASRQRKPSGGSIHSAVPRALLLPALTAGRLPGAFAYLFPSHVSDQPPADTALQQRLVAERGQMLLLLLGMIQARLGSACAAPAFFRALPAFLDHAGVQLTGPAAMADELCSSATGLELCQSQGPQALALAAPAAWQTSALRQAYTAACHLHANEGAALATAAWVSFLDAYRRIDHPSSALRKLQPPQEMPAAPLELNATTSAVISSWGSSLTGIVLSAWPSELVERLATESSFVVQRLLFEAGAGLYCSAATRNGGAERSQGAGGEEDMEIVPDTPPDDDGGPVQADDPGSQAGSGPPSRAITANPQLAAAVAANPQAAIEAPLTTALQAIAEGHRAGEEAAIGHNMAGAAQQLLDELDGGVGIWLQPGMDVRQMPASAWRKQSAATTVVLLTAALASQHPTSRSNALLLVADNISGQEQLAPAFHASLEELVSTGVSVLQQGLLQAPLQHLQHLASTVAVLQQSCDWPLSGELQMEMPGCTCGTAFSTLRSRA